MKFYRSILCICLLFIIADCKKHPHGGNPHNEFKATVSFDGGDGFSIDAHGDQTIFAKTILTNGDTVIYITGDYDKWASVLRAVSFTLCNINAPGTYKFTPPPASGTGRFINGDYAVSGSMGLQEYYSTVGNDSTSTITITDITATHIAGTVSSVYCGAAPQQVQIKYVSFKGDLAD